MGRSQPIPRKPSNDHRRCQDTASASCIPRAGSQQERYSRRRDDCDMQRATAHRQSRGQTHREQSGGQIRREQSGGHHGSRQQGRAISAGREDAYASRFSRTSALKSTSRKETSSRSVPQFCPPSRTSGHLEPAGHRRSGISEAEWQATLKRTREGAREAERARYAAENRGNRAHPGEELPSPIRDSYMEPHDCGDDISGILSNRSRHRQSTREVQSARARVHEQPEASQPCMFKHEQVSSRTPSKFPESAKSFRKNAHDHDHRSSQWGSLGSSASTAAYGSVIDSCTSDLWDTCSVDSLPLGAEWFNFMHAY